MIHALNENTLPILSPRKVEIQKDLWQTDTSFKNVHTKIIRPVGIDKIDKSLSFSSVCPLCTLTSLALRGSAFLTIVRR